MSANNYVIVKDNDKESDSYGKWRNIQILSKDKKSIEEIKQIIDKWEDQEAKPILIEDEQSIAICEFMLVTRKEYYDDDLKEELKDFKYQVRNIIGELEGLL